MWRFCVRMREYSLSWQHSDRVLRKVNFHFLTRILISKEKRQFELCLYTWCLAVCRSIFAVTFRSHITNIIILVLNQPVGLFSLLILKLQSVGWTSEYGDNNMPMKVPKNATFKKHGIGNHLYLWSKEKGKPTSEHLIISAHGRTSSKSPIKLAANENLQFYCEHGYTQGGSMDIRRLALRPRLRRSRKGPLVVCGVAAQ